MKVFAELLDRLAFTPSRNGKLALLEMYFRETPPEDAGVALAILTGNLEISTVKPAALRDLVRSRMDPVLFDLSYEYVGDQAETIALLWKGMPSSPAPTDGGPLEIGNLSALVKKLQGVAKKDALAWVVRVLDALTQTERWAFLKLVTGATLRIGVSARLAKTALARSNGRDPEDLEKVWGAFTPPYQDLFQWLDHGMDAPVLDHHVYFHTPLLAHPLDEAELGGMNPMDFAAEWKWDGIRIQLASDGKDLRRLYSRSGDEISGAFPEILERANFDAVVDGELLVIEPSVRKISLPGIEGDIAPFSKLQQRLNRKKVSPKLKADFPVVICLYDMLFCKGEDIRAQSWLERRMLLEEIVGEGNLGALGFRLSCCIPFQSWEELRVLRDQARAHNLEGLMLKRKDSSYVPGRPKGFWFKWKRNTLNVDAVLMYARRGHGKRASFFSDTTFGLWRPKPDGGNELVPVGKAYSGFTDEELGRLDKWIRAHTVEKFGSVRSVSVGLVLEVEFDAVQVSSRHKSGLAMRFPRIQRIRWDKKAEEADVLDSLRRHLPNKAQSENIPDS